MTKNVSCLENLFTNSKDFYLYYGADGFLYSQHKSTGVIYVLFDAEWETLEDVWEIMNALDQNLGVDFSEDFEDDS